MEQPTTSFKADGRRNTVSHLSWFSLEPTGEELEGQIRIGITMCGGRQRRQREGKINLFDVIGDRFQLQKYKRQLLHFQREIFRGQHELIVGGGSELEECC